MGESHYCENCDECDDYKKCGITTTVIESYLKYKNGNGQHKSWMTTFTRFTNIFFGKHCDTEEINIFGIQYYSIIMCKSQLEGQDSLQQNKCLKIAKWHLMKF